jgi:predicted enzyme related to lactoylglutathione lyase
MSTSTRQHGVMLRGLTTLTLLADDVAAAADWYAAFLGAEPYFRRPLDGPPAYVEFRIGDYEHELGIMDARYAPLPRSAEPGGVVAYWAVDDVRAVHARLLDLGAATYEPPTERGPGFTTASVVDPWGNVLGVMENRHYLDVLGSR